MDGRLNKELPEDRKVFWAEQVTELIIVLVLDRFRILEIIIVTLILIQLLWFLC